MSKTFYYEGVIETTVTTWPQIILAVGDVPYNHWQYNRGIGSFIDNKSGDSIQVICLYDASQAPGMYLTRYIFVSKNNKTAVTVDALANAEYMGLYPGSAGAHNPNPAAHWLDGSDMYFIISWGGSNPLIVPNMSTPGTHSEGAYRNYIFKFSVADVDFTHSHYVKLYPNFAFGSAGPILMTTGDGIQILPVWRDTTSYISSSSPIPIPTIAPHNFPDIWSEMYYIQDNGQLTDNPFYPQYGSQPFACRGERSGLIGPGNYTYNPYYGSVFQQVLEIYRTIEYSFLNSILGADADMGPPWYTFCQIISAVPDINNFWPVFTVNMDFSVDQSINRIYCNSEFGLGGVRGVGTRLITPYPYISAENCVISSTSPSAYLFASWEEYNSPAFTVPQAIITYLGKNYTTYQYNAADASNGYIYLAGNLNDDNGVVTYFPNTDRFTIYRYDMVGQKIHALPLHTTGVNDGIAQDDFIVTKDNSMLMYRYSYELAGKPATLDITNMILPITIEVPLSISNPVFASDIRTFY